MNSFEFNKFALALLATIFVMFSASLLSEAIFHAEAPETPGFAIAAAEPAEGAAESAEAAPAGAEPVSALLASADLTAGESAFKKCASCHTWEEGGANKVGPNLWAVVGRAIAGHEGFSYSAALKAYAEGGKAWDFEELNGFLWNPKKHVPGTAMGFAGLKNVQERANLIAWMNTHNASPLPLPEAAPAPSN